MKYDLSIPSSFDLSSLRLLGTLVKQLTLKYGYGILE